MATALFSLGLPLAVHIADGMLRTPWLAGGFALAGLLTLLASYKVRDEEIPRIALLGAAFFVATLMHLPLGPTSVHLLLNGLVGVVLGRRAPLAISIGLVLQAALFGHGGFTSLGVNACVQILPALLAAWLFAGLRHLPLVRQGNGTALWLIGCLIGVASVLAALVLKALVLLGGGAANWRPIVQLEFLAHLPVAAIEGVVLGFTVSFLARVKPEMLGLLPGKEMKRQKESSLSLSPCLLVSLSSVLLMANSAHAHRLDAGYVVLPDRRVRVEAWFDLGGGAPKGAAVKVFGSAQRLLAAGQARRERLFHLSLCRRGAVGGDDRRGGRTRQNIRHPPRTAVVRSRGKFGKSHRSPGGSGQAVSRHRQRGGLAGTVERSVDRSQLCVLFGRFPVKLAKWAMAARFPTEQRHHRQHRLFSKGVIVYGSHQCQDDAKAPAYPQQTAAPFEAAQKSLENPLTTLSRRTGSVSCRVGTCTRQLTLPVRHAQRGKRPPGS